MPLGQPADGVPVGGLDLGSLIAIALVGNEGRQQVESQSQQVPEQAPLHGVDPLAVLTGLPHEVPEGLEPLLGLEGRLLRGDDHGEVS